MADVRTNATYYDNVRVPARYLIGGENNGWGLITNQLNHERVSLFPIGPFERLQADVQAWAKKTKLDDGRRVIDQPHVRRNLAKCHAGAEALKLMLWKQAWTLTHSRLHPAEASTVKVYASEFFVEAYRLLMEVFGAVGKLKPRSPGAVLAGRVERSYRAALILTFGGGTNEVQRDIIAMAGLQMPHYKA